MNIGRWQVTLRLRCWVRGRGLWPDPWRELGMGGPMFHRWALGPIHVRHYRFREG